MNLEHEFRVLKLYNIFFTSALSLLVFGIGLLIGLKISGITTITGTIFNIIIILFLSVGVIWDWNNKTKEIKESIYRKERIWMKAEEDCL